MSKKLKEVNFKIKKYSCQDFFSFPSSFNYFLLPFSRSALLRACFLPTYPIMKGVYIRMRKKMFFGGVVQKKHKENPAPRLRIVQG